MQSLGRYVLFLQNNMNTITQQLKIDAVASILAIYHLEILPYEVLVNETKPEFEGDFSIVTFALSKQLRRKPDEIANELGAEIIKNYPQRYQAFSVIQGFLNITIQNELYLHFLQNNIKMRQTLPSSGQTIMVEFSSPNTNKPLHFGHLRNNFLGDSISRILVANGHTVIKSNLLNDRGIHICKSMYAWQQFANGETPETNQKKGDHLVGHYYVLFENKMKEEAAVITEEILNNNYINVSAEQQEQTKLLVTTFASAAGDKQKEIKEKITAIAKTNTSYMLGAKNLLVKWENNDADTIALWKTMNNWVVAGFENTYAKLDISFDKYYKESETYLLGKEIVEQGLAKNILFKKPDNSIWIDLNADGLDEKLLLRGDGTSVYITQDIGTAQLKYNEFGLSKSLYVIADEQNYHMQVLQLILSKLGEPCAAGIHHVSYGLVELPSGRMKTREGTVVDADDTIDEMIAIAEKHTTELGKVDGFSANELHTLYNTIGLGALKFFLLRVDAKKKMIFNPEESIDFHGFTGPFVQYAHARTCAILRKENATDTIDIAIDLEKGEKQILKACELYTQAIQQSANEYNPSILCNYIFGLAKQMNFFLAEYKVLSADTESKKILRLQICKIVKDTIAKGLDLLGMQAPNKM
jgi:arginyl-tRNA synthetase